MFYVNFNMNFNKMFKAFKISPNNCLPIAIEQNDMVITMSENDAHHPRKGLVSKVLAEDPNPRNRRKMPASTPIYFSEEIHSVDFNINFWVKKKFLGSRSIKQNFNEA